jgi:hypothetical protein
MAAAYPALVGPDPTEYLSAPSPLLTCINVMVVSSPASKAAEAVLKGYAPEFREVMNCFPGGPRALLYAAAPLFVKRKFADPRLRPRAGACVPALVSHIDKLANGGGRGPVHEWTDIARIVHRTLEEPDKAIADPPIVSANAL